MMASPEWISAPIHIPLAVRGASARGCFCKRIMQAIFRSTAMPAVTMRKRPFMNGRALMPIPTSAETEAIARQLATLRGQTVEEVVSAALRAELMRERRGRSAAPPVELTPAQRAKVERIMEL